MSTLNLDKKTAVKIYKAGSTKEVQVILMSTFGNELFLTKITERVTSFKDAYDLADEQTRKECEFFPTDTPDVMAYKSLKLIIKVLNEDFVADWNNTNQRKWFPVFKLSSGSGFVFSASDYYCTSAFASVGSRLCLATEELADYVGKHFQDLYMTFLTIK